MSGLGRLNKSLNGVVIELVQLKFSVTETKEDLKKQTEKICEMVRKAKRFAPPIDLGADHRQYG